MRNKSKGRGVVVRKGEVVNTAIDLFVRVSRTLCPELPDCPVLAVFEVQKADEGVCGVAVGAPGVGGGGAGGGDYWEELGNIC